jgi:tRNA threonylcarbamoyladenosine biosynthesis protein TsaE
MQIERSTLELASPEATERFGRLLGSLLFPGAVVALSGPLGAGKTFLTRAVARGLGVSDERAVTSPTFVLIQEYQARLPIYHFDLYRLPSGAAFHDLGAGEYLEGQGVCLIEWADKFPSCLPDERLEIRLEPQSEQSRLAELIGSGERYATLVHRLASADR